MLFGLLPSRSLCNVSLPNAELLKPPASTELIKTTRLPEDFTTAVLAHFCSQEFGGYGVGARIINNDPTNTLTYRLHSNRGTARIVPISSEIVLNEWFDIIVITPDGTTGVGQLELDIVQFQDARRSRRG